MTILVIADHDNKRLNASVAHTISAAHAIGGDIHVLVAGHGADNVVQAVACISGVGKVLYAQAPCLENGLAENVAAQVLAICEGYDYILFPATSNGKNVAPRVAAKLNVAQISEITKVIDGNTFERFIYSGNALVTIQSMDAVKVLTVRASAFEAALISDSAATVENINAVQDSGKSVFVRRDVIKTERPDLGAARVVVAGGKAFTSQENFENMLYPLADKLNAALGATRSAIDAGYAPNDWQLGQTGKVVAPELYIAVGISGAVQHTSGIKDSKVIVAINDDPDAPIFKIADYGLVGDLNKLLPELIKAL